MSAVPSSSQLAVVLPAAAPTVTQAELAQDTHNGISNVNTMLDDVLGLVDAVRSYEPTSRTSDSRTWGPFADSKHPGWQWELVVTRSADGDDVRLRPGRREHDGGNAGRWVQFLTGTFDLAGRRQAGERHGDGQLQRPRRPPGSRSTPARRRSRPLRSATRTTRRPGSPVSVTLMIERTPDRPTASPRRRSPTRSWPTARARSPSRWSATSSRARASRR